MKQNLESSMLLAGLLVVQAFVTVALYIFCTFISLFVHYSAGGLMTFALYALVWWFIWWLQSGERGIQRFYTKLVFSTIPLIVFTAMYILLHPVPEDSTMIPLVSSDIHFSFASAVTGTLLFPLYSLILNQYFLSQSRRKFKFLTKASGVAVLGVAVFTSCYSLLPPQW